VRRLILLECAILGVVGSVIGIVLGTVLALVLSTVGIPMPPPPNTDLGYVAQIRLVPQVMLSAFAVGTVSAIVAGILPSWKIAAMKPVDALRRAV
jgi:putative ABC transport system permease protein